MGTIIAIGIGLLVVAGWAIVVGLYGAIKALLAWALTPRSHRRIGAFRESKGAKLLEAEGYDITPDWRRDAVARNPTG